MRVFISSSLSTRTRHRVKKVRPQTEVIFDQNEQITPSSPDDMYHDDIGEQLGRPQPQIQAMSAEYPTTEEQEADLIHLDANNDGIPDDEQDFKSDLDDVDTDETVKGEVETTDNKQEIKQPTSPPAGEKENADDGKSDTVGTGDTAGTDRAGAGGSANDKQNSKQASTKDHSPAKGGGTEGPVFFKVSQAEITRQALFSLLAILGINRAGNLLYRKEKEGVFVSSADGSGTLTYEEIATKFQTPDDFLLMLRRNGGIPLGRPNA